MGVLRCSVKSCDRIMCNTYLEGYGYICDNHLDSLIELAKAIDFDRRTPESYI